ncbi:carboxylesterase/lipase family protein [Mucilaginibacter agri]|uniref:Carboxylic ester hydrolase n=1 Tax=Mucilaginibacter agri TaxID=2695265 RepID=A0A965ZJE8_9SPHI|nr:carboxylesterase family protein [Mucilaginibacter agri]NCD70817.1 carboxylesterase family protein [Mucilaginibacter agri]
MKKASTTIVALIIIANALFASKPAAAQNLPTVKVEEGMISGTSSADGAITEFKGIPFAAPPVGNLRWKAPQPAAHWDGIKKCDAFGPSPMQPEPKPFFVWTSEFLIPKAPISEDCLYLNVWTNMAAQRLKPVFVWIYGGGFSSGGSAAPIYDGEAMARKDVVFVSINYRVGVFGFFAHPELSRESLVHSSGNYGLMDQIAALKWVKKNIAAFGGDPDNVTIAGQSAGSMSVNYLVASPKAKGLFNKAIAESGSMLITNSRRHMTSLNEAEAQGAAIAKAADNSSLADMREMNSLQVLEKLKGNFTPIADGYDVLPEPVYQIFAENKQNNVPLITGWNADEGMVFAAKNKEDYIKQIRTEYGADANDVLKYYPASTDAEAADSQVQLSRDLSFALSGYQWAKLQSSRKNKPVYVYNFTRRPPATADFVKYKSFHTAEVPYALDDLKFLNRPLEATDRQLSKTMSAYWVNFIKTGNPNGAGLPQWPQFNERTNQVIVLGDKISAQTILNKQRLDFMLKLLNR